MVVGGSRRGLLLLGGVVEKGVGGVLVGVGWWLAGLAARAFCWTREKLGTRENAQLPSSSGQVINR